MATLVTQTKKILGFFDKVALRPYEIRLARAEREVNYHRVFLEKW